MTIKHEQHLPDFEFWCGAAEFVAYLTSDELELLDYYLDDYVMTPTELNDMFWFEQDIIADMLHTTTEEIYKRKPHLFRR